MTDHDDKQAHPDLIVRAGWRIALAIALPAIVMIPFVPRGSAEFVILIATITLGMVMVGVVIGLAWLLQRLP